MVGSSGSGKSTILKLILGYYKNYHGEITMDGIPLRDINLDSLYDQISIIQQDVFLFDSSIENNITMFRSFDESKLNSAIERAGLLELIKDKEEIIPVEKEERIFQAEKSSEYLLQEV